MKKVLTLLFLSLSALSSFAQTGDGQPGDMPPLNFPGTQRATMWERGTYTCEPCYTWTEPTFNHFKNAYGDSLIVFKSEQFYSWAQMRISTNIESIFGNEYNNIVYGVNWGSPTIWLNQVIQHSNPDDSAYRAKIHYTLDSFYAIPAIASPVFNFQKIGTDSLVVNTHTKFLQNTTGDYRVTVLMLEDSIYFQQNGSNDGMLYHMNVLKGPNWAYKDNTFTSWVYNQNDSLNYTLGNGSIAAGTIVSKSFHFKLDTIQNLQHIRPLVLVTRYDPTAANFDFDNQTWFNFPRHLYINAAEIPNDTVASNNGGNDTTTSVYTVKGGTPYEAFIYPNPAVNGSAQVYLKGLDGVGNIMLTMYDAIGRVVLNQPVHHEDRLPIQSLAPATYIYHFTVDGKRVMQGSLVVGR